MKAILASALLTGILIPAVVGDQDKPPLSDYSTWDAATAKIWARDVLEWAMRVEVVVDLIDTNAIKSVDPADQDIVGGFVKEARVLRTEVAQLKKLLGTITDGGGERGIVAFSAIMVLVSELAHGLYRVGTYRFLVPELSGMPSSELCNEMIVQCGKGKGLWRRGWDHNKALWNWANDVAGFARWD